MDVNIEELFCELMDLDVHERMNALDAIEQLSSKDKQALKSLIVDAQQAESYFSKTSAAVKMVPTPSRLEGAGDMCGPYKLERKLGEGGFGLVWLAQQERPLKRTVAVKVIKAGMDTDEVLARFDAEKQALARMEHPNIAKVLDAGMTENCRPYFVMELVEGMPITRYCHEHELSTRERLRLFADICNAINHAHQKGVIHRDIKPTNVIVTEIEGKAVVKVIDFGIAKAVDGQLTDHTLRTREEQWIGTPAYMSPEQASLAFTDLDTRSDIYTLGVLLYELITGVAPFDSATLQKAGYEEMRRIIREEEPPRPSARITTESKKATTTGDTKAIPTDITARGIASELDWIVMKSIEKSRDRRYGTAAALADDIGRYLADEPIEARPPSALYILVKFARRHRLGLYIGSSFLILIAGVVVLSVSLALRARNAENAAQESLTKVRQERDSKNKALEEVLKERDSKNKALEEAESVSGLLVDVLQRPQSGVDGRSVTVVEALDAAAKKLESQLLTQPKRRAKLRGVLADTYESLGVFDRSLKLRQQSYDAFKENLGVDDTLTRKSLRKMIEAYEAKGDCQISLKYALIESDIFREMGASGSEIENSMRSLIIGRFGVGERQLAIKLQQDLISHSLKTFGKDSLQHVKAKRELRQYEASSQNLSSTKEKTTLKELVASEKKYAERMKAGGPTHDETIDAKFNLAVNLHSVGHSLESLIHLKELQATMIKKFGPGDIRTLKLQKKLVRVYLALSQPVNALRTQQAIMSALRKRDGIEAGTTRGAEFYLQFFFNQIFNELGDDPAYKDLLERSIQTLGADHPDSIMLRLVFEPSNVDGSIKRIKIAVDQIRKMGRGPLLYKSGPRHYQFPVEQAIAILPRAYVSAGRVPEAIPYYEQYEEYVFRGRVSRQGNSYRSYLGNTSVHSEHATFQLWMGDVEGYRNTRSNIIQFYERSILSMNRQSDISFLYNAIRLSCLADVDDEQHKIVIRKLLDHAHLIRTFLDVEAEEKLPQKLFRLQTKGAALYRLGMYKEALSEFQKTNSALNLGGTDFDALGLYPKPWVMFFMAMTQHRLGNQDEAMRLLDLGESNLKGIAPSEKNPVIDGDIGGKALTLWIMHKEAKALISKP